MNPLARQSLHRAPARGRDMPHVPDNRQRLRTYRQLSEPRLGNNYPWPHLHGSQSGAISPGPSNPAGCQLYERYAREQCADGPPDLITHYADRRGV